MIGSPASPMTGLSPLPGGGSASVFSGNSVFSSLRSTRPMPGKLLIDGVNRRRAWSSRYCGVLMVAAMDAPLRTRGRVTTCH